MLKKAIIVSAALLALSACGDGDGNDEGSGSVDVTESPSVSESTSASPSEEPTAKGEPTKADLLIRVTTADDTKKEFTLKCEPAEGTVPDPEKACDVLAEAAPGVFEPIDKDMACTAQIGGPETAHVTGTYNGRQIDSKFDQTDGCQIGRFTTITAITGIGPSENAGEGGM